MYFQASQPLNRIPPNPQSRKLIGKYRNAIGVWIYDPTGDAIRNISDSGVKGFSGLTSAISAGRFQRVVDPIGFGLDGLAYSTSSQLPCETPNDPRFDAAFTKGYTYIFAWRVGGAVNSPQLLFSVGNVGGNGFGLRYTATTNLMAYYHVSSTGADLNPGAGSITLSNGDLAYVVVTCDGAGNLFAYINGKIDKTSTGLGVIQSHTFDPQLFGVGGLTSYNIEGVYFMHAFFDYSIDPDDARLLSINPWQMIESNKHYFPLAAPVSGFNPVWARPRSGIIGAR